MRLIHSIIQPIIFLYYFPICFSITSKISKIDPWKYSSKIYSRILDYSPYSRDCGFFDNRNRVVLQRENHFWKKIDIFSFKDAWSFDVIAKCTEGMSNNSRYWVVKEDQKCIQNVILYAFLKIRFHVIGNLADRMTNCISNHLNCYLSHHRHIFKIFEK